MTGNEKREANGWLALADTALIRISGADAESFLQGQLSNDLRLVTPTQGQFSSYNSPKGRMLAVLHLMRAGEGYLAALHAGIAAATLKRLRLFVLRAKVMLEDGGADWASLGLFGEAATAALNTLGLPAPADNLGTAAFDEGVILRHHGAHARYSLHAPAAVVTRLASQLGGLLPRAEETDWARLRIEAGEPCIYAQTSDHFVAQMCNLDRLGGINFKKGCYTGQEVIARLHYLGTLKRRMLRAETDAVAAPAQAVFDARGDDQAVGEIVDARRDRDRTQALVVLQLSHLDGDLRLGAKDGPRLHLLDADRWRNP